MCNHSWSSSFTTLSSWCVVHPFNRDYAYMFLCVLFKLFLELSWSINKCAISIETFISKGLEYWELLLPLTCITWKCYIFCLICHIWPPKTVIKSIYLSLNSLFENAQNAQYVFQSFFKLSYKHHRYPYYYFKTDWIISHACIKHNTCFL